MDEVTWDDLMNCPPASHVIRKWSGIIDPKLPVEHPVSATLQILKSGVHEPQYNLFRSFPENLLCLDVGANCGQSIASIKLVCPSMNVYSFEPNPLSFRIAVEVANRFTNCSVKNFGLGENDIMLEIFTPVIDGLLVTPLTSSDRKVFEPGGAMFAFTTESIAKGCAVQLFRQNVNIKRGDGLELRADVIKIDVEGAEMGVLKGLSQTISKHRPLMMIEKSDWVEIAKLFKNIDYTPFRYDAIDNEKHTLKRLNLDDRTDQNSVPINVFYVANERIAMYASYAGLTIC